MSAPAAAAPAPVHRFEAAGLGTAPFRMVGFQTVKYQACPGAPIQAGSSCDYCGQAIMLVFAILSADGRRFKVGCDCVAKTGDAGLMHAVTRAKASHSRQLTRARAERARDSKRASREQAARARRKATRVQAVEFARAHGLVPALRVALKGPKRAVARELLGKLVAYGSLTPGQTRFLVQLGTRLAAAPTGRVTFTGVIDSVKAREGMHAVEYKMTVTADAGFRAWMTAPSSLLDTPGIGLDRFRGVRVTVTATLSASGDDPGFAFGKRPRVALAEPAPPAAG